MTSEQIYQDRLELEAEAAFYAWQEQESEKFWLKQDAVCYRHRQLGISCPFCEIKHRKIDLDLPF